mmetsp:Transcript_39803/g.114445  ORF Transcript_39803/g.114445 Transcript_39803/m.114445 type:complete len:428 (-) Transcript_39803:1178-2461(-)
MLSQALQPPPLILPVRAGAIGDELLQVSPAIVPDQRVEVHALGAFLLLHLESLLALHIHRRVMHVREQTLHGFPRSPHDAFAELKLGGLADFGDYLVHVQDGRCREVHLLLLFARVAQFGIIVFQALLLAVCTFRPPAEFVEIGFACVPQLGVQPRVLHALRDLPLQRGLAIGPIDLRQVLRETGNDNALRVEVLKRCLRKLCRTKSCGIRGAVLREPKVQVERRVLQHHLFLDHASAIGIHVVFVQVVLQARPDRAFAGLRRGGVGAERLNRGATLPDGIGGEAHVCGFQGLHLKLGVRALLRNLLLVPQQALVDAPAARLYVGAEILNVGRAHCVDGRRKPDVLQALSDVAAHLRLASGRLHLAKLLFQAGQHRRLRLREIDILAELLHVALAPLRDAELQAPIVVARLEVVGHSLLAVHRETRL